MGLESIDQTRGAYSASSTESPCSAQGRKKNHESLSADKRSKSPACLYEANLYITRDLDIPMISNLGILKHGSEGVEELVKQKA